MSTVRLIPLGVGEAFTACHYTSCLALGVDDAWMLIDCPHPVRKMLHEGSTAAGVPLDLDRIQVVAVSHLHADHASGLEDYGYFSHFVLGRRARLMMHPEIARRAWEGLLAAGMDSMQLDPDQAPERKTFADYFELIPLEETRPVTSGPFAVECRRTIHSVPTTAFRIRAGGRTFGFSADTAFDSTLIDWLAPSDLIVHEVTTAEHSEVHSPYVNLTALPAELRARIRLTHYPDGFDAGSSLIEPLHQGRCYVV